MFYLKQSVKIDSFQRYTSQPGDFRHPVIELSTFSAKYVLQTTNLKYKHLFQGALISFSQ